MNPLELQVLSIVYGVAQTGQPLTSTEPVLARPSIVALPPTKLTSRPSQGPAPRKASGCHGGLYVPLELAFIPRPVTKQIDTLLVAVEKLRLPSDLESSLSASLRTARTAVDTGRILLALRGTV